MTMRSASSDAQPITSPHRGSEGWERMTDGARSAPTSEISNPSSCPAKAISWHWKKHQSAGQSSGRPCSPGTSETLMGVGYAASALHRVSYLEPDPDSKVRLNPPPIMQYMPPDVEWDGRPRHWRSPKKADIVSWRERVSSKYNSQLGEPLSWDESDNFNLSEDVATSADMLLRYVTAVLDQRGSQGAAAALAGMTKPPLDRLNAVFAALKQPGLTTKFPHLLLGAR